MTASVALTWVPSLCSVQTPSSSSDRSSLAIGALGEVTAFSISSNSRTVRGVARRCAVSAPQEPEPA